MKRTRSKRVDFLEVLGKLEQCVPVIREGKGRGRIRYPVDFKASVVEVIESGMDLGLISRRLGISVMTLRAWMEASANGIGGDSSVSGVRELVLVPEVPATNQEQVRIRLGERVYLEIPVSLLRGDLLRELVSLGGV